MPTIELNKIIPVLATSINNNACFDNLKKGIRGFVKKATSEGDTIMILAFNQCLNIMYNLRKMKAVDWASTVGQIVKENPRELMMVAYVGSLGLNVELLKQNLGTQLPNVQEDWKKLIDSVEYVQKTVYNIWGWVV